MPCPQAAPAASVIARDIILPTGKIRAILACGPLAELGPAPPGIRPGLRAKQSFGSAALRVILAA
jgi:hypothetical protein